MSIKQLQEVLIPPDEAIESGKGQEWGKITSKFGAPLPTDYMQFVELYGSGEIGGWLTVFNPFSKNPNISLLEQFFCVLSSISEIKKEFPESCPYPLLFEPGGLLPWGISIDGDIYCWSTSGSSGKWKIVIIGRHSEPEEFQYSFSEFLSEAIKGNVESYTIPQEWKNSQVNFVSYQL
ncbi:SMI1/KNR4 family protein [Denitromonas halophila]|uniref:SMI1/KNR4 family protein n=1 Tax=Denitromonas halophila TaxID=1629404 RepID=A0A557QIA7_9RHOO|nr:SMI1/KNR4 family protein [Denitromonas halophila]TVO52632.1 hypothetical protein FHP91_16990 [Denitromonas halophila]